MLHRDTTSQAIALGSWCLVLFCTAPAQAAISEYATRSSFAAAIVDSATDTFADLDAQLVPTPLTRPLGRFSHTINAFEGSQSGLVYGLASGPSSTPATWLTTDAADSVLTFRGFAPDVNAIGASFFLTNFSGDIWLFPGPALRVAAIYAGGTVSKLIAFTTDASFLGFVSADPLLSLEVSVIQSAGSGPYWLTVADLTVASLSPIPEASTTALLSMGLSIVAWLAQGRRRTPTPLATLRRTS